MIILKDYANKKAYPFSDYEEMDKFLQDNGIYVDISTWKGEHVLYTVYSMEWVELYNGENLMEYIKINWDEM